MVSKKDIQDEALRPAINNILEKTGDRVYSNSNQQLHLFEIELKDDKEIVDETNKEVQAKTKLLRE